MTIGAVSGYGSIMGLQNDYKINSIYGNPKSMSSVAKIGDEQYSGNPFAVVTKKEDEESQLKIKEQQAKPFDFDAAVERAKQGMTTAATSQNINFDMDAAMTRLMQGTRFSADTIPVVDLSQA